MIEYPAVDRVVFMAWQIYWLLRPYILFPLPSGRIYKKLSATEHTYSVRCRLDHFGPDHDLGFLQIAGDFKTGFAAIL